MKVEVPDIGDFTDVPVVEIYVAKGDTVAKEDPLIALESEKATMDVPSPEAGTVTEVLVKEEDEVSKGTPIIELDTDGGDAEAESEPETEEEPEAKGEPEPEPEPDSTEKSEPEEAAETRSAESGSVGAPVYASPSVRRLAREKGVNLERVEGSGRKGRITKEDVERGESAGGAGDQKSGGAAEVPGLDLAPWPSLDFDDYGETERVKLSRIKRISGPNLARNWVMIPHVTHDDEADVTDLEAFRKQVNSEQDQAKVTMVALLMKAVVASLKEFPDFNSSLDGDELILKRYFHIGFAADTPQGLLVPVIRDVDKKGLLEVAAELTDLSGRARDGKLAMEEMRGSTFTISSLGGIGGTSFTPIINAPEVAILGATRSAMKPVWDGEQFVPRLMVPLSLSYDHRVIDGASAARFCVHLTGVLSDLRRVLL